MASRSRIPVAHREHAAPEDILPKLSQAEANRRAEAVAGLHASAERIGEKDTADATRDHAERMRRALPFREKEALARKHREAMASLPGGADGLELRMGYNAALTSLDRDNPYPSDILQVLADAEGHPATKSAATSGRRVVSRDEIIAKAVQKARVDLDARVRQLRQEIEDFKRERGIR